MLFYVYFIVISAYFLIVVYFLFSWVENWVKYVAIPVREIDDKISALIFLVEVFL